MVAQLQIGSVDEREGSLLEVEIDHGLFEVGVDQELAGAKSALDERVSIELCELGSLEEGRHEEGAVGTFFGGVDDFLHIEATTILSQDALKDHIIGLLRILLLSFALLDLFPDSVRLL